MIVNGKNVRLPKRFKDKWVKALRSKNYKQGKNYLYIQDKSGNFKYCCMGVLCEISGKEYKNSDVQSPLKNKDFVPKDFRECKEIQERLSKMNDSGRWSFNKISNWIEKNL